MSSDQENQAVAEKIASYAPEYKRDVLKRNLKREYTIDRPQEFLQYKDDNPRDFLQNLDQWQALHYWLRFYLHADATEIYGEPAARTLEQFESRPHLDPDTLCQRFIELCDEKYGYDVPEKAKHRIRGAARLYNEKDNVIEWVQNEIDSAGKVKPIYDDLTNIKHIGRKIATFTIRDTVWIWDIEDDIVEKERRYLQPIDRWVRRTGDYLFPDLTDPSDAELAGELAEMCNKFNISNIAFNQGAFYVGAKKVEDAETFDDTLRQDSPPEWSGMAHRALLTDRERELIEASADAEDDRRYQAISRVRRKINEELTTDVELLREHHPDLYAELQNTVCNSEM